MTIQYLKNLIMPHDRNTEESFIRWSMILASKRSTTYRISLALGDGDWPRHEKCGRKEFTNNTWARIIDSKTFVPILIQNSIFQLVIVKINT